MAPIVSVIIPTLNRPHMLVRAVRSVLAQTLAEIEVVVVIDGPDAATVSALKQFTDPRVRILALPENVGGSDARNAGVRAAKGGWVAFLDDDDEWLPEKLARQLETAGRLCCEFPVIGSLVIARSPNGDFVWPRRRPHPGEPMSEYLLARTSIFRGEGLFSTITLLVKKQLMEAVPFCSGLSKFQDWQWMLQADQTEGVCFEIVPEPLAIMHMEERRRSVSAQNMWRFSLAWLRKNRHLVTPRAYACFIATQVASEASKQRQWKAFGPLLREMVRFGAPRTIDYLLYLGMWLVPEDMRRKGRAVFHSLWR